MPPRLFACQAGTPLGSESPNDSFGTLLPLFCPKWVGRFCPIRSQLQWKQRWHIRIL